MATDETMHEEDLGVTQQPGEEEDVEGHGSERRPDPDRGRKELQPSSDDRPDEDDTEGHALR